MSPARAFCAFACLVLLAAVAPAAAQPVAINDGRGQGLLVRHSANCFVVLPDHVHPEDRLPLSLFTAAPQRRGSGFVMFRRPEPDLALAEVAGGATERCERRWRDWPEEVARLLNAGTALALVRITPQGTTERLAMRVDRIAWEDGYQYVYASTDAAGGERRTIFQGSSGAFLFAGDRPVAMVLNATNAEETQVRALRLEEIREPIDRWLRAGALAGRAAAPEPGAKEEAAGDAVPVRITEWSREPVEPGYAAVGLADGANAYRADLGPGAVLVAEVAGDDAVAVGRLTVEGSAAEGVTTPKLVVVETSAAATGERWTQIWANELPPSGAAREIPVNGLVKRLRLSVVSVWAPGRPFEMRGLALHPPAP